MLSELAVGKIGRTHGVHGEVRVHVTSDDPRRMETLSEVKARKNGKDIMLRVESVRYAKGTPIVKFREWNDPESAALYTGAELFIERKDALPLGKDEYFIGDLIGCRVETEDGKPFGILTDVLQTGANDVYEVKSEEHGEVLIPAIKDCVIFVSPEEERIVIRLMKGLLGDGL